MANAVIYARYSSGGQQTDQSIEGQLKACYEYARANNINIIGEYLDRATSGKSTENREAFQRMINDSGKQQFEMVLLYQLDRFSRNRYDSAIYRARLKKNGVKVVSVRETISDDASGILMEALLEGMAEYYSAELAQKIRRGMAINAEKKLVFGSVPFGYKSVEKQFVIDQENAIYVRQIFQMYLEGKKMIEICDYLNGLGIKTGTGVEFKITSINKILQNKRYAGYYTYKDQAIEDAIPAIVSKQMFEEVQIRMARNKKRPSASKALGDQYLLTGKLYCGHCGGTMRGTGGTGRSGHMYQYYACINRINKKKTKVCDKSRVSKDRLEEIVIKHCYELLSDENINKIADEVMKLVESEKEMSNYNILVKTLEKLERQKQNLINSLTVGSGSESFQKKIFEQFEAIERQEVDVKREMMLEDNIQETLTREHILFFLHSLRNGDIKDAKYRQMLVDVFVNKIYLFDDRFTIVFTTQHDKVEFDVSLIEDKSGSYLDESSPVQSSPVQSSPVQSSPPIERGIRDNNPVFLFQFLG